MKVSDCYNCGCQEHSFYAEENGFSLVKCVRCGLLFVANRPGDDEISQAHKQGKHRGINEVEVTGSFQAASIPKYIEVLKDLFAGDIGGIETWLDVGCGHGEFMAAVKQYSRSQIRVRGTDPNIYKQKSARQRGLDVDYFDIDSHEQTYDVVSLLNVYSHLPDPPSFLESLKNRLNPRGELLLETGDTAGLSARDHYRPFYLPDHLSFASEEIVAGMLEKLGFEIISIRKYPSVSPDLRSIVTELAKLILPNYESRIRYYLKWKLYAHADMYIRARLIA